MNALEPTIATAAYAGVIMPVIANVNPTTLYENIQTSEPTIRLRVFRAV